MATADFKRGLEAGIVLGEGKANAIQVAGAASRGGPQKFSELKPHLEAMAASFDKMKINILKAEEERAQPSFEGDGAGI